jgi:hypothetical protein
MDREQVVAYALEDAPDAADAAPRPSEGAAAAIVPPAG